MSRRMRAGEGYSVDDAGLYPPPMGDYPRGRSRGRTFGDDQGLSHGPPPANTPAGGAARGYGLRDSDVPRRNYRDGYASDATGHRSRDVHEQSDHRREARRRTDYWEGDVDDRRRNRSSVAAYPPSPPRRGQRRYDEYDTAPRRAKSTSSRRPREDSPPRVRRYESPSPVRRQSRYARRDAKHGGHLDDRLDDSFDGHDGRVPRGGPSDGRRARAAYAPAYDDGYRPQPRRRSSLDGLDRGPAPRGRRYGGSPSPAPGPSPRSRHRSVPPRPRAAGKQPSVLASIPWQTFARTAFTAGAQAAFRARKDPSPWVGEKGARVATAAIGAALVDGFVSSKHPDKVGSKRHKGLQRAAAGAMDKAVGHGMARKAR